MQRIPSVTGQTTRETLGIGPLSQVDYQTEAKHTFSLKADAMLALFYILSALLLAWLLWPSDSGDDPNPHKEP